MNRSEMWASFPDPREQGLLSFRPLTVLKIGLKKPARVLNSMSGVCARGNEGSGSALPDGLLWCDWPFSVNVSFLARLLWDKY